jgi:hypothetical protein
MNIKWSMPQDNSIVQVELIYNVYTGRKKLYIAGKEILSLRKIIPNTKISFSYKNKEYKLQLIPEGYGYTGNIITPEGDEVYPDAKNKVLYKIPLWILPFVIINMAIPIISVEAFTPWIIGISSSYITARFARRPELSSKIKTLISFTISTLAWTSYYMFYLFAKKSGISGGFISFK